MTLVAASSVLFAVRFNATRNGESMRLNASSFGNGSGGGNKGGGWFKKRWEEKSLEDKRWFLYVTIAIIATTAVYLTPDEYSEHRFQVAGWIVLLGLHLVIWPFFTEKTSLSTKIVITGFLLFFISGVIFPNATKTEVANVQKGLTSFDENYGKRISATGKQQTARITLTSKLSVVPGGIFKKVEISPEKVIEKISWSCPKGCIAEIQHEGDLLCNDGNFQGVSCVAIIVGYTSRNVAIYREQFKEPPGDMHIVYPKNFIHVIYSFGTIREFGPVDIDIKAVVSG